MIWLILTLSAIILWGTTDILLKKSLLLATICAKIYSEECWKLPGGFSLPIAVVKETIYTYEQDAEASALSEVEAWLEDYAKSYLQNTMIAGEVLSSKTKIQYDDAVCYLYGKYACREMIGKTRVEQGLLGEDTND